jgi:hypothetical protein
MGNPKNEYGILSFPGDSPTVLDWTKADPEGVSAAMRRYARPENRKKYDPIANFLPAALAMANRAPNRKQAIIVLTDGVAPASSRTRLSEAKEGLRTGSVALYCISVKRAYQGITEAPARSSGLGTLGSVTDLEQELKDLGKLSGGVSFFPASIQQTAISFGLIATILRNQYALEIAKPAPRPGKPTHKVRVEVEAPRALKGKIQLQAHHRAEYVW